MDVSARIDEMIAAVRGVDASILGWVREECEGASDEIAQLNRDRLMEGNAPDGTAITPFYSPYTVMYKRKRGGIEDRVTLYDYGNFHASLRCQFGPEEFWVETTDADAAKVDWLLAHYSGQVLGFSEADAEYISAFIVSDPLIAKIHEYIKTR